MVPRPDKEPKQKPKRRLKQAAVGNSGTAATPPAKSSALSSPTDEFSRDRGISAVAAALISTVREPLIILDSELNVVTVGRSFCKKFGISLEDSQGRKLSELGNGQWDIPALYKLVTDVVANDTAVEGCEIAHDFKSIGKRTMLVNIQKVTGARDSRHLILIAIEDITQQKTTSETLDVQTARLESILQSAQVAIVSINEKGIIKSFSAAAETMFGYTEEEVIGRNVNILMPEPDHSRHDDYIASYLNTGEKKIIGIGREVTGRRKDGTELPLDLSVGERFFDHQRLFTGVMRDLTLDKKRQAELIQAQKMEAMGQLTGGVAHDFNNLLTVILGNLELLEQENRRGQQAELCAEAREAVKMGSDLTRGLLAFGRRLPLRPEEVDLNELILQMSALLKRTLPESIQVSTVLGNNLWSAEVDPAQLQNAVLNLGLNARDAMPDGGKLIVETSNKILDEDYATFHPDVMPGDYIAVAVTDNGTGMAPDVRRRAFEPFFTTKQVGEGTGLGLSMIYGFVRQSGGHATIYSDLGQGATITMFFPRKHGASGAKPSVRAQRQIKTGGGETILVVEDDPRVRRVTLRRLDSLGYKVIEAENGPAALAVMDRTPGLDLLFTDMVMPGGIGGGDLARMAREKLPGLRVLLTSGYAEEALDLEQEEFLLRKPYTSEMLAQKIRDALEARHD